MILPPRVVARLASLTEAVHLIATAIYFTMKLMSQHATNDFQYAKLVQTEPLAIRAEVG